MFHPFISEAVKDFILPNMKADSEITYWYAYFLSLMVIVVMGRWYLFPRAGEYNSQF